MLNNTANSNEFNPNPSLWQRLKGKKRKFGILFLAIIVAGFLAYITTQNQFTISNPFNRDEEPVVVPSIVDEETGELTEDFYKNITDVTLEQVKEASVSTGVNALDSEAISDEETSKQIYKDIGNDEPQNKILSYGVDGISEPYIEVRQGDLVTWFNDSNEPMIVKGEGWETKVPRDPGDQYSYGFLFIGEYKYTINGEMEGTVNVVKP